MTDSKSKAPDVATKIRSVDVQKLDENSDHSTPVIFDFGANLEEAERSSEGVVLNFRMTMDTEPQIAKFVVEGSARLSGEESEIEKLLAPDPQTNVPIVFTRIYQTVYSVIFMLAGTVDVPYPSPALLKRPHVRTAYSATQEVPSQTTTA